MRALDEVARPYADPLVRFVRIVVPVYAGIESDEVLPVSRDGPA
jgi:hypothetical protein